ncbi:hypothetical protein [Legionella gresilensis]|uniref:hypothetical protein n=1 Tax=Legionella gresilensis TaxID=91823 RepID=UPI001041A7C6|nr:hypothetical protein [Legionella gresilensis]
MKNSFFQLQDVETLAKKFIDWLDATGRCGFQQSVENISNYFSEQFSYYTNEELVADSPTSLQQRFSTASEVFSSAFIHFPIKKMDIHDSKVEAQYDATFINKDGNVQHTTNTLQFEFDLKNKVQKLSQSFNPPLSKVLEPIANHINDQTLKY